MLGLLISLSSSLMEPGRLRRRILGDDNYTFLTFSQNIDHSDPQKGTFKQRYEALFDYTTDNKTAILFIGGESDTFRPRAFNDYMATLCKEFNAAFFMLEHRYFGESFPTDLSYPNIKYLTVDNAIDDLYNFKVKMVEQYKMTDSKWILVGGSYPGLLSAYTRAKYPKEFHASIASSGVVIASNNYEDFDRQIAISLGQSCASVAREIRRRTDELLETDPDWLLATFNMTGLEKENFPLVLGEIFSLGAQYGRRQQLCGPLEDTLITGADPVMAIAKYTREIFTPNYADDDIIGTYSNSRLSVTSTPNGPRAWLWMTCNELAYWQVNSGRLTLRSKKVTQDFFLNQCKTVFSDEMKTPDTDAWNQKWGDLLKKTSRIYYLTGSQDPWTPVCYTAEDSDKIGPNCYVHTIVGQEIGHCRDLSSPQPSDPTDLTRTREHVKAVIHRWLAED
ncbi:serine-type peptidase protein [Trichomonas vaginalis G3]|nr:serine-type peptidase protein [Trichomonas vaginalis G3]KAI5507253.1 serine-type peptidase protein [Trichomonas vaginalis G3]